MHVPRALLIGRIALLSPVHQELSILIELGHARSVIAIGDEHGAIGKPSEKRWAVEMCAIGAGYLRSADGLQQLLPVMGELVDNAHMIVDDPNVLFRIVRIDGDEVRSLQNLIPLGPSLDDVAVCVGDGDAVLPFRVDAHRPRPSVGGRAWNRAAGAAAGQ